MKVIASNGLDKLIENKQLLLDNDFLGCLFSDSSVFQKVKFICASGSFLLDPLTRFEFLRGIYVPKLRIVSEEFIKQPFFFPAVNHQTVFMKQEVNSLLLSQLYSHNNCGQGCSFVDLFLGARLMLLSKRAVLITGDKKHFPSCIFDLMGVISVEMIIKDNETFRNFAVISFNEEKFSRCYSELEKLDEKYRKELADQSP